MLGRILASLILILEKLESLSATSCVFRTLRTLALKGIEVLFVPSAFYTPRHDQWDVLVQSAALDNLLYVVALNQYNEHFLDEAALLTLCGLIVSKVSDQEGIMYGILDMNYQQTVRSQVPTYQNRRPELYEVK